MKSQNEAKAMKKSQDQTRPKTKQILFSVPHKLSWVRPLGKARLPLAVALAYIHHTLLRCNCSTLPHTHSVYMTRLIALCLTASHMRYSGSCISVGSHAWFIAFAQCVTHSTPRSHTKTRWTQCIRWQMAELSLAAFPGWVVVGGWNSKWPTGAELSFPCLLNYEQVYCLLRAVRSR